MLERQKTGSVVCPSCGRLVGITDAECYNCGRRNPGMWGFAPLLRRLGNDFGFVPGVMGMCVTLYAICLVIDPSGIRSQGLFSMLGPSIESLFLLGASGAIPVFNYGRWWTLLSAAFLHGGLLHILFNMLWIRQLAPATADLYGASRMVIIYTVSSITGFFLSSWAGAFIGPFPILGGASFTVGASAPIFGLLGALVFSGRRGGDSMVGRQALFYAAILFFLGVAMPGVDNWAHGGGFLGGYLMGMWLDPLRPERMDHLLMALGCMILIILSIVISVLHGLKFL